MTSEYEEVTPSSPPLTPPQTLRKYEVLVAMRRESTHKKWNRGDIIDTADVPEPVLRRLVKRGIVKEVVNG